MSSPPLNLVDALVLALIALAIWNGYRAGFVATVYSLATWIFAAAAALAFGGPASTLVATVAHLPKPLASSVAFIGVIVLFEAVLAAVGHFTIHPLIARVRAGAMNLPDRVLGTIPSAARSLVIVAVAILAIETLPVSAEVRAAVEASRSGQVVGDQVASHQAQLAALASQLGGSPLLVTRIGEDQSQKLDLPDGLDPVPDSLAEAQLLGLVNDERTSRGLAPLVSDERLIVIARAHSREMFVLKYFSHESPGAGSPFDRLRAAGISNYARAGENLAYAQSVVVAHRALMDSPAHRENILQPEFRRVGIGIEAAGVYGRMVTQLFITP